MGMYVWYFQYFLIQLETLCFLLHKYYIAGINWNYLFNNNYFWVKIGTFWYKYIVTYRLAMVRMGTFWSKWVFFSTICFTLIQRGTFWYKWSLSCTSAYFLVKIQVFWYIGVFFVHIYFSGTKMHVLLQMSTFCTSFYF